MDEFENVEFLIKKTSLIFDKIMAKISGKYNLSASQILFLHYLMISTEPVKQVDLEKFFSLKNPTVTGILNTLEKKKLIERKQNPNDLRSNIIVLTDNIKEIHELVMKKHKKLSSIFSQQITLEEKETLVRILMKVISLEKELENI